MLKIEYQHIGYSRPRHEQQFLGVAAFLFHIFSVKSTDGMSFEIITFAGKSKYFNMKKILLILASLSFVVACGKEETPVSKESIISKIEVDMGLEKIHDDVNNYFDITYNYVDFKGEKQTKKITSPTNVVFSIEKPDLVDENSTPITFTIEMVNTEKAGATPKAEGEKYNSTIVYEIVVNGQYVDKTVENFQYCCYTRASEWKEAPNYKLFSTVVMNLATEKTTYKMYLVKNQDGNLRLKIDKI